MKIGVSSYSYSRLVRAGQMTQVEVVSKAKEMGFDTVEIYTLMLPEGRDAKEYALEIKAEAERVGIPISSYTFPSDVLGGPTADVEGAMAKIKEQVDIAEILGAPSIRHDAFFSYPACYTGVKSFYAVLPQVAKATREIAQYAADKGIKSMVENHGHICQGSERMEALVTEVNHPNFGLLVDMGNFNCVDENSAVAVGKLVQYAMHCHAKDFHIKSGEGVYPGKGWSVTRGGNYIRGAIIGHGNVPVAQCVRILKSKGFDGALSIEFEGMEDVLTGIALGQENLRRFLELA